MSIVSSFQLGRLNELMMSSVSCLLDTTSEQVVTLLQKLLPHWLHAERGVSSKTCKLYFSPILSDSADQLREVFSKYGKVEHCRLVRDIGKPHLKKQAVYSKSNVDIFSSYRQVQGLCFCYLQTYTGR